MVGDDIYHVDSTGPFYGIITTFGYRLKPLKTYDCELFSPYILLDTAVWLSITEVRGNVFEHEERCMDIGVDPTTIKWFNAPFLEE